MARDFHPERYDPRGLQKNQRALEELLDRLFDVVSNAVSIQGPVVINEDGDDVDFRVEGDTEPNLLFVDASTGRVGIGTSVPGQMLDVAAASGNVALEVRTGSNNTPFIQISNSVQSWRYQVQPTTGEFRFFDATNNKRPFKIFSNTPEDSLRLETAGVALFGAGSFGGGSGVLFLGNRTTAPTSNPTGGGIPYAEAGAYKYRGSSGTITTLAPA